MKPDLDNQHCRVLLVDDAPENLRILSESLRDDYTIMFAKNGPDALRLARRQPPDLILLDVIMPGMDGYEVCRRLKEDAVTRDIPIMFITAQNEETDEATGFHWARRTMLSSRSEPLWYATGWPISSDTNATATTSMIWCANAPASFL